MRDSWIAKTFLLIYFLNVCLLPKYLKKFLKDFFLLFFHPYPSGVTFYENIFLDVLIQ